LAGAAGVVLGLRDDVRRALDDRERRQLLRIRGTALVLVFAAAVGFAATAGRGAVWPLAIYFAFVSSLAGVYLGWLPKVVERRYLADAGGDAEGARQRLRERRLRTFFGWLGGAVAGGAGLLAGLYAAGQLTHF
ncbi:MAG: sigma-70 family RNA polymerase sigma factor, partial [Acidobacteriota bacterium]